MRENELLRVALIISFIGLLFLYFISGNIEIKTKTSERINNAETGQEVIVKGIVSSIRTSEKASFVNIETIDEENIVVFENIKGIKQGDYIEVVGKIDEYNGKQEIIAEKIRKIGAG